MYRLCFLLIFSVLAFPVSSKETKMPEKEKLAVQNTNTTITKRCSFRDKNCFDRGSVVAKKLRRFR